MGSFWSVSLLLLLAFQALMQEGAYGQFEKIDMELLASAKMKWETLQEDLGPLDYKYLVTDVSEQGDGPSIPVIVLVEQDEVTEVEEVFFVSDEDPVPEDFLTVNAMFDLMENEMDAGSSVVAFFDRTYGYPLEFTITNEDDEIVQSVVIDPITVYTLAQSLLDTNLAVWNQTDTSDYDYTLRLSCFCIPAATTPKRIEVRDDMIETIIDIDTGIASEDFFYGTIEEQFDEIQNAIDGKWFVVDVSYNETLGYPSSFFFDVHPGLADEERSTEIYDVVILDEELPSDPGVADSATAEPEVTPPPTLAPSAAATEDVTDPGMQSPPLSPPSPAPTSPAPTTSDSKAQYGSRSTNLVVGVAICFMPFLLDLM